MNPMRLTQQHLKYAGAIASLFLSALIGWYVNYYLSHAAPQLTIERIEFYYQFPEYGAPGYDESLVTIPAPLLHRSIVSTVDWGLSVNTPLSIIKRSLDGAAVEIEPLYRGTLTSLEFTITSLEASNLETLASHFIFMLETNWAIEILDMLDRRGIHQ